MLHLLFFNLRSIVVDFHTYLLFLFLQSNPDPLSLLCVLKRIHQIIVYCSFQIHAVSVCETVLFDFLFHFDLVFAEHSIISKKQIFYHF